MRRILVALSLLLTSCDGPAKQEEVLIPTITVAGGWNPFPEGSNNLQGVTASLSAGKSVAFITRDFGPAAGETITAHLMLSAQGSGGPVRMILYRHCNADAGDEGDSVTAKVTREPKELTVSHKFAVAYSCIRLELNSAEPLKVNLTEPQFSTH